MLQITVEELLDCLDGYGIIFTDERLVADRLKDFGLSLNSLMSPTGIKTLVLTDTQEYADDYPGQEE